MLYSFVAITAIALNCLGFRSSNRIFVEFECKGFRGAVIVSTGMDKRVFKIDTP